MINKNSIFERQLTDNAETKSTHKAHGMRTSKIDTSIRFSSAQTKIIFESFIIILYINSRIQFDTMWKQLMTSFSSTSLQCIRNNFVKLRQKLFSVVENQRDKNFTLYFWEATRTIVTRVFTFIELFMARRYLDTLHSQFHVRTWNRGKKSDIANP